jgi:hypothetical protein
LGTDQIHALFHCKSCPSYHNFYPQLLPTHSEQYQTTDLLVLYMTSCHQ